MIKIIVSSTCFLVGLLILLALGIEWSGIVYEIFFVGFLSGVIAGTTYHQ